MIHILKSMLTNSLQSGSFLVPRLTLHKAIEQFEQLADRVTTAEKTAADLKQTVADLEKVKADYDDLVKRVDFAQLYGGNTSPHADSITAAAEPVSPHADGIVANEPHTDGVAIVEQRTGDHTL
jgi:hypothetical protein